MPGKAQISRDQTGTETPLIRRGEPAGRAVREAAKSRFLETLYKAYWDDLCGWLRQRYGAGPPEPEDIAQTAFEKVAASPTIEKIRYPKAFLYNTALNAATDKIRWLQRTRTIIDDELHRRGADQEELTPERLILAREQFDVMARQMGALTEKQKDVLIRSRFMGQTIVEIAEETGWSTSDIFRQLKTALISVRDAVDTYDQGGHHEG